MAEEQDKWDYCAMLVGTYDGKLLNGHEAHIQKIRRSGEERQADKMQRRFEFSKLCRSLAPGSQLTLPDEDCTDWMNQVVASPFFGKGG